MLVTDKRSKGSKEIDFLMIFTIVYDRFYNPLCPLQKDIRTASATPGVGSYFRFHAPVRISGVGGTKLIYPKDALIS